MTKERLTPKFLTREVANLAVNAVLRMVMEPPGAVIFNPKRRQCYIVVLVPSISHDSKWPNYLVEALVLYEHSVGMQSEWEHPFDEIARRKAAQLWQGRNDDRTDSMPHLLVHNDTPFWGGVKRNGIVVACSGVQPWLDKMIAGMVADACIALAYEEWIASEDRAKGVDFLT